MTLTRSSVLHYWSSRYGPLPIVGGRPTHARNSAATVGDARGELYDAIINTPRFSWETDKATSVNERRAMLLLELGRLNTIPFSTDFTNAAWSKVAVSLTTGISDPRGGTNAVTVTATGNPAGVLINPTGSSLVRSNALWVRRRTGSGSIRMYDPSAGAPTIVPTATWQRFQAAGTASTNKFAGILVDTIGDAVDVYNVQQEDGPYNTSDIVNVGASSTARAADVFSQAATFGPQAMMAYLRYVAKGGALNANSTTGVLGLGDGTNGPRFLLENVTLGTYRLLYQPVAAGTIYTAGDIPAPAIDGTGELIAILTPTGQIRLLGSVNAGTVADTGLVSGAAIPTAWSDRKVHLGDFGTGNPDAAAYADLRVVQYADVVATTAAGIMDELRAFELGPNGDIL